MVIWFRHLLADWWANRQPELKTASFVLIKPDRGRMIVAALNKEALKQRILEGMTLADGRALVPELHVLDYSQDLI